MTHQATGRREQNKLDTRRAIAEAALNLARTQGMGAVTADQIAEEAKVSRRTFFNYFHSAEDALTVSTESFLEHAVNEFASRPLDEPLLDAIIAALAATAQVENLNDCGDLFRLGDGNPDLLSTQLLAWERAEARIVQAVEERLDGSATNLYILALVGSVLSCAKAAMREWSSRDPVQGSAADLEHHIVNALSMLRDGFAQPTTT